MTLARQLSVRAEGWLTVMRAGVCLWPLLMLFTPSVRAEDEPKGVAFLARAGADHDTDNFSGNLLRAGALFNYASYLQNTGVAVQTTHYAVEGWSMEVPGIIGIYRNQRRDTLEGIRAEAGVVRVSGHARVVGDATWSYRPRPSTGLELVAAGDVVGTRKGLEQGIAYGLVGASVEQQFPGHLTAVALLGWQPFTDGNSRILTRGRLIIGLLPEEGLSAQFRWRYYTSSKEDVDRAYFNPDEYRNGDLVLSLRRRVAGWTVMAMAGLGREKANDAAWNETSVAEFRIEGQVSANIRLELNALYSRAAGFADSPNYGYGTVGVNLIVPLPP